MEVPEVAVEVERLHLAPPHGAARQGTGEDAMSEPQGSEAGRVENTRRLPVLEKPDYATADSTTGAGQSSSTAAYDAAAHPQ